MAKDYQSTKARMTAAKGVVTRSIKKLESACEELTRKLEDIPERTKIRLAEEILDNREKVEKNLVGMEEVGETLTEVIATLDPTEAEEELEKMISKVDEDIDTYAKKYEMLKKTYDKILETVDALLTPQKTTLLPQNRAANSEFERFSAVPDLKPVFLDKEATMIEVNQWCEQFFNYIMMGYRNSPPKRGVSMHLGPLVQSSWLQSLETKDMKNKTLQELMELIKEEGKLRMPCHQRRLQLLKAKRNSNKHSNFLYQLETLMSVAEFSAMSADEMVIHLFAETADVVMSKLALEILANNKPMYRAKLDKASNSNQ